MRTSCPDSEDDGSTAHADDSTGPPQPTGPSPSQVVVAGYSGDLDTARGATRHPDPRVRMRAFGALIRLGIDPEEVLRCGSSDPDPAVRRQAIASVAGAPPTLGLVAAVALLLDDPATEVVQMAATALGELAPERHPDDAHTSDDPTSPGGAQRGPVPVGSLINRLHGVARHHRDELCREAAIAALGAVGDPRSLGTVLEALQDRPAIRRRAVVALAAFDGDEVETTLRHLTDSRDWQVRQIAEDLLAVVPDDPDPDPELQRDPQQPHDPTQPPDPSGDRPS